MKLKTDNEHARELLAHWRSRMALNRSILARSSNPDLLPQFESRVEAVDGIDAHTATLAQVMEATGYAWTKCTNCGAMGDLVEIGDHDEDDAYAAYLCLSCCEAAVTMFKTA